MKQYRLIKPFLYYTGEIVEPQSLYSGDNYYWAGSFGFDISFVESNTEYFEEVKPERWKPENGDTYFYIGGGIVPKQSQWDDDDYDARFYKSGNCFQTEEQAEEAIKRFNQTLMDYQDELLEAVK